MGPGCAGNRVIWGPGLGCFKARATSCSPADLPRQDLCSSSHRRTEEVGSDSGTLKAVRQLPISPNNPSGPGKGHLNNG